jgi:hypothetical protein
MGRITRYGYHASSAEDARRRIVSFFDEHLSLLHEWRCVLRKAS